VDVTEFSEDSGTLVDVDEGEEEKGNSISMDTNTISHKKEKKNKKKGQDHIG
jgi:hypothetical protein